MARTASAPVYILIAAIGKQARLNRASGIQSQYEGA
jgi:hypothetical protein